MTTVFITSEEEMTGIAVISQTVMQFHYQYGICIATLPGQVPEEDVCRVTGRATRVAYVENPPPTGSSERWAMAALAILAAQK